MAVALPPAPSSYAAPSVCAPLASAVVSSEPLHAPLATPTVAKGEDAPSSVRATDSLPAPSASVVADAGALAGPAAPWPSTAVTAYAYVVPAERPVPVNAV